MDLVTLPPARGERVRINVKLHTGRTEGPYHFFLGNKGIGASVFFEVRYHELGAYTRPEGNLMIVDLLQLQPDVSNLKRWRSAKKFTDLFGFSEPDYIHPLLVNQNDIDKADPELIVFSPTAADTEIIDPGKKDLKRHSKGIGTIIRYAEKHQIPILGICAGHQSVAQHYGAFLARLRDDHSGGRHFSKPAVEPAHKYKRSPHGCGRM